MKMSWLPLTLRTTCCQIFFSFRLDKGFSKKSTAPSSIPRRISDLLLLSDMSTRGRPRTVLKKRLQSGAPRVIVRACTMAGCHIRSPDCLRVEPGRQLATKRALPLPTQARNPHLTLTQSFLQHRRSWCRLSLHTQRDKLSSLLPCCWKVLLDLSQVAERRCTDRVQQLRQ